MDGVWQRVEIEYKGEKIVFNEKDELWSWQGSSSKMLSSVKTAVDRAHKVDYKDAHALVASWHAFNGRVFRKVRVTSKTDDGQFWITYEGTKKREKTSGKQLYLICEENKKTIARIKELEVQTNALRAEAQAEENKLIHFEHVESAEGRVA